jgi:hypothetical protein
VRVHGGICRGPEQAGPWPRRGGAAQHDDHDVRWLGLIIQASSASSSPPPSPPLPAPVYQECRQVVLGLPGPARRRRPSRPTEPSGKHADVPAHAPPPPPPPPAAAGDSPAGSGAAPARPAPAAAAGGRGRLDQPQSERYCILLIKFTCISALMSLIEADGTAATTAAGIYSPVESRKNPGTRTATVQRLH